MKPAVLTLGVCGAFIALGIASPVSAQVAAADVVKLSVSTVAADHRALAAHYRTRAAEHDADAARHDTIAADAKTRAADDDSWDLVRDTTHYAQHAREAAGALRDLAQLHEAIAERLGAQGREAAPAAKACCGTGMAKTKGEAKPAAPAPTHEH